GGSSMLGRRLRAIVADRADLLDACAAACLCHFDFHAGNILARNDGGSLHLSGVLDFEGAMAGDPLMDIAKALCYFTAQDHGKKAGLFAGYGLTEGQELQDALALYHLYCMIELWCWFAQIGNHEPLVELTRDLERFG
ncbi:MAG TPA: phosphotransferase, partial [Steroidobacteraceae bacterium]